VAAAPRVLSTASRVLYDVLASESLGIHRHMAGGGRPRAGLMQIGNLVNVQLPRALDADPVRLRASGSVPAWLSVGYKLAGHERAGSADAARHRGPPRPQR
jgi:hypothetical protein